MLHVRTLSRHSTRGQHNSIRIASACKTG
jgi:hypothetical protein